MPIYEYGCEKCGERFEQLVRTMGSTDLVACPKCSSTKTTRALSVFAVGAEGARSTPSAAAGPGMCGRCGGPRPCASGD